MKVLEVATLLSLLPCKNTQKLHLTSLHLEHLMQWTHHLHQCVFNIYVQTSKQWNAHGDRQSYHKFQYKGPAKCSFAPQLLFTGQNCFRNVKQVCTGNFSAFLLQPNSCSWMCKKLRRWQWGKKISFSLTTFFSPLPLPRRPSSLPQQRLIFYRPQLKMLS